MKRTLTFLSMALFLASVGRAQVVLPPSSDYNDPYNYYRDCVSNNGSESESVCEQQTGALFPEENAAPDSVPDDSAQADSPRESIIASNLNGD